MPLTAILKQRLVGAMVLIALAVIFVPMFLEGPSQTLVPAMEKMPQPDRQPPVQKPQSYPDQVELEKEPEESVLTAQPSATHLQIPAEKIEAITPPPSVSKLAEKNRKTKPQNSWVIQVGSFASKNNALALRNKLRKSGLPTQVEKVRINEHKRYRVRVGPYLKRNQADSVNKQMDSKFSLQGTRVMAYP